MKKNNQGFDIRCPRFRLVEVRARTLGSDGPFPRVTLRKAPDGSYDYVAAIRFSEIYARGGL
jgi:hypothetical protein